VFLACVLAGTAATGRAQLTLLTFDDLPDTANGLAVPSDYGGLHWQNVGYLDVPLHYGNQPNGYQAGMVSAPIVIYNRGGNLATISRSTPFDFVSAYLTAAWYDNLQVEVLGYAGNTLTYSNVYAPSATAPARIDFDYLGVDEVTFSSFGGTLHPGYSNGGEMFVMDNLMVNIPEPAAETLAMLGAGLWLFRMKIIEATKDCAGRSSYPGAGGTDWQP